MKDNKDLFSKENIKANLSKIKVALGVEEEAPTSVELEDIKKVDGTILRIEPAIEIGATVQVIGEDAELIEAPDGDHELESGDVIKTEGGVIIEIMAVEAEVAVTVGARAFARKATEDVCASIAVDADVAVINPVKFEPSP